ncbi:MAG: hypothetical protein H8E37_13740 [Planctomycetes bacterium]|nr:hypothetical protein [Planctomycetota bacterium]
MPISDGQLKRVAISFGIASTTAGFLYYLSSEPIAEFLFSAATDIIEKELQNESQSHKAIKQLPSEMGARFSRTGASRLVSVAVASGWWVAVFVLLSFAGQLTGRSAKNSKVWEELNHWARTSKNLGHTFRGNEQSEKIAQKSLISLSNLAEHLREKSRGRLCELEEDLPPKGRLRDTIQLAISEIDKCTEQIVTDLKPLIQNSEKRSAAKSRVGELGRLLESLSVRLGELKGKA